MHKIKQQAIDLKEIILTNRLNEIGQMLHEGWLYKRQMANGISTPLFEQVYETAMQSGATGGKISGAGGGGFVFFYCPGTTKYNVVKALNNLGGYVLPYSFTKKDLKHGDWNESENFNTNTCV